MSNSNRILQSILAIQCLVAVLIDSTFATPCSLIRPPADIPVTTDEHEHDYPRQPSIVLARFCRLRGEAERDQVEFVLVARELIL